MRRGPWLPAAIALSLGLLPLTGCSGDTARQPAGQVLRGTLADTTLPGTVFRYGPEPGSIPSAPIAEGIQGQASIYEGYFSLGGCDGRLRPAVRLDGDTVVVTIRPLVRGPDSIPCGQEPVVMGYGLLVGTLPAGDHLIRMIHADQVGAERVDTVYRITVGPPKSD